MDPFHITSKKVLTLVLVIDKDNQKVLLGYKKRGFGAHLWNGFGGKVEAGETVRQGALRELEEEAGITVEDAKLQKAGILLFLFENDPMALETHVYKAYEYNGQISECEEMRPQWFNFKDIPFDQMWEDDRIWLPELLKGNDPFFGRMYFKRKASEEEALSTPVVVANAASTSSTNTSSTMSTTSFTTTQPKSGPFAMFEHHLDINLSKVPGEVALDWFAFDTKPESAPELKDGATAWIANTPQSSQQDTSGHEVGSTGAIASVKSGHGQEKGDQGDTSFGPFIRVPVVDGVALVQSSHTVEDGHNGVRVEGPWVELDHQAEIDALSAAAGSSSADDGAKILATSPHDKAVPNKVPIDPSKEGESPNKAKEKSSISTALFQLSAVAGGESDDAPIARVPIDAGGFEFEGLDEMVLAEVIKALEDEYHINHASLSDAPSPLSEDKLTKPESESLSTEQQEEQQEQEQQPSQSQLGKTDENDRDDIFSASIEIDRTPFRAQGVLRNPLNKNHDSFDSDTVSDREMEVQKQALRLNKHHHHHHHHHIYSKKMADPDMLQDPQPGQQVDGPGQALLQVRENDSLDDEDEDDSDENDTIDVASVKPIEPAAPPPPPPPLVIPDTILQQGLIPTVQGAHHCTPQFCVNTTVSDDGKFATFHIERDMAATGWISLGIGYAMTNADLIILWPNPTAEQPRGAVLSRRTCHAYVEPQLVGRVRPGRDGIKADGESEALLYPSNEYTLHNLVVKSEPELSAMAVFPNPKKFIVQFTRPIKTRNRAFKLTPGREQDFCWAYSPKPISPDSVADPGAHIAQHLSVGSFAMDVAANQPHLKQVLVKLQEEDAIEEKEEQARKAKELEESNRRLQAEEDAANGEGGKKKKHRVSAQHKAKSGTASSSLFSSNAWLLQGLSCLTAVAVLYLFR
ncbi:hypothetical protein BGZ94_010351 [Podila epigama]|nr:hypothetical protein BGZ94_010351 [Podila epigama]